MHMNRILAVLLASSALVASVPGFAETTAAAASDASEIIVTATKRSESLNKVPLSISVQTGDQLLAAGVTSANDLGKVVPGFTFTQSAYSTPVYSIRGVGFYDYSIGATPTVSVYIDEAPLPFSSMTRGAGFDLQRVEVLKGPQGLLFGSNSTGGAVNYVAARPTTELKAGFDAGYGRFNSYDVGGFVSGPLGDGVAARLAIRHEGSDDWQNSTTRNATSGGRNFTQARFLLDVNPGGRLSAKFNVNGFLDKGRAQAAQLIQINPLIPPFVDPRLLQQPLATSNARQADWTTGTQPLRDDSLIQATMRIDYELSDAIKLTSLTAWSHYKQDDRIDPDGTSLLIADTIDKGSVDAIFQELRASGEFGNGSSWIVGGNYERNRAKEVQTLTSTDATGFRFFNLIFGIPTPDAIPISSDQRFETKAAFANVDLALTDTVKAHAGVRYTDTSNRFIGCTGNSANGSLGLGLSIILGVDPSTFANAKCTQLDATLRPAESHETLSEDNVSWRVGLDFKPSDDALIYANVSQGFKSGGFPVLPATSIEQYTPVTQEKLLAYELGFKASFANRMVQLNGAVFHYDYTNKQVLGSVVLTPNIFGPLNRLVNIPKSKVSGAELQLILRPAKGLTINVGGTYVDSKIGDFTNYDPFGQLANFDGQAFPNTPKWQVAASADYEFPISVSLNAFLGGNLAYNSRTNGALGEYPILAIDSYALVDVRAGVASSDDRWRVSLWGRNIGNKYYWSNAYKIADVSARFAGQPATFGASLSWRY